MPNPFLFQELKVGVLVIKETSLVVFTLEVFAKAGHVQKPSEALFVLARKTFMKQFSMLFEPHIGVLGWTVKMRCDTYSCGAAKCTGSPIANRLNPLK